MKNKKNKVNIAILLITLGIIIGVLFLIKYMLTGQKESSFDPGKYEANITFETVSTSGKEKMRTVRLKSDGKSVVARNDYLDSSLYVTSDGVYITQGGRYKKTVRDRTYLDLYNILYNLDYPKEDGNYNPRIDIDTANEILDCLLIDSSLEKEVYANVSFKEDRIRKFSIYLSSIEHFDKLDISLTFSYKDDDFENSMPVFYDEVTDKIDETEILISD